jgi:hypothetical protein
MYIEDPLSFYFPKEPKITRIDVENGFGSFEEFLGMNLYVPIHKEFLRKVCGRIIADNRKVFLYEGIYYIDANIRVKGKIIVRLIMLDVITPDIYLTAEGSQDIATDPLRLEYLELIQEEIGEMDFRVGNPFDYVGKSVTGSSTIVELTPTMITLADGKIFTLRELTDPLYSGLVWWASTDGCMMESYNLNSDFTPNSYKTRVWNAEYDEQGSCAPEYYGEYPQVWFDKNLLNANLILPESFMITVETHSVS